MNSTKVPGFSLTAKIHAMKMKTLLSMTLMIPLLFTSCIEEKKSQPAVELSESNATLIAEDIIYDVEIKNPSTDDPWMENALKGLQREALIDFIFDGIYDKNLQVFDIFEGTRISAQKILKMEEEGEFSRDEIGKIQFTEQWMYDSTNHVMTKKVTAISLGIQNFDPDGYLIGYYPLFKVILP